MKSIRTSMIALFAACGEPGAVGMLPMSELCAITGDAATTTIAIDGDADRPGMVGSLAAFRDGSFVIADRQRPSVWLYANDGTPIRRIGRQGRGPGEFESVVAVHVTGEEIVVVDNMLRRMTLLGRDGSHRGDVDIARFGPGVHAAFGPYDAGEWLLVRTSEMPIPRDRAAIVSDTVDVLLLHEGDTSLVARVTGRTRYADLRAGFSVLDVPFTAGFTAARTRNGIVFGDGRTPTLMSYAPLGGVGDTLRLNLEGERVTPDMERAYVAAVARRARDPERVAALLEQSRPWPERTPVYARIISDGSSELLIERYTVGDAPREYVHFDVDGQVLQAFTLPAGMRAMALSRRIVFAVTADGLGRESVVIFEPRCER